MELRLSTSADDGNVAVVVTSDVAIITTAVTAVTSIISATTS